VVIYNILENFDDRLPDTSKATKARIAKHGQHKLGTGGYLRLQFMNRKYPNILRILIVSPYNFMVIAAKNIKKPYPYAIQGDDFETGTMEEDLQLGYKYGYKVVVDRRKIMGQTPRSNLLDKVNKN
jgi:hypothetical protein